MIVLNLGDQDDSVDAEHDGECVIANTGDGADTVTTGSANDGLLKAAGSDSDIADRRRRGRLLRRRLRAGRNRAVAADSDMVSYQDGRPLSRSYSPTASTTTATPMTAPRTPATR